MPLSHFLFDRLFSTFSCCFYFLKNKVPKSSLMVRNSREILFLLFSLSFRPTQAHIRTTYFRGCRGRQGTHFIPSSLVIHFKRCLLIKQFKHFEPGAFSLIFTLSFLVFIGFYSSCCFPCVRDDLLFLLH